MFLLTANIKDILLMKLPNYYLFIPSFKTFSIQTKPQGSFHRLPFVLDTYVASTFTPQKTFFLYVLRLSLTPPSTPHFCETASHQLYFSINRKNLFAPLLTLLFNLAPPEWHHFPALVSKARFFSLDVVPFLAVYDVLLLVPLSRTLKTLFLGVPEWN